MPQKNRNVDLLLMYMQVSRAWNNYTVSVANKMTTEKAIAHLNTVIQDSTNPELTKRAKTLLNNIITQQAPDKQVEEACGVETPPPKITG